MPRGILVACSDRMEAGFAGGEIPVVNPTAAVEDIKWMHEVSDVIDCWP
jgi:hypothetical protein